MKVSPPGRTIRSSSSPSRILSLHVGSHAKQKKQKQQHSFKKGEVEAVSWVVAEALPVLCQSHQSPAFC